MITVVGRAQGDMADAAEKAPSRGDRDGALVWIKGALNMLRQQGVDASKVERLAREIKVSKGSFYWFFKDIDDLLDLSLVYWKAHLNNAVFDRIRGLDGSAHARLSELVDTVFASRLGRYDAAIRAWAMTDPKVLGFVRALDRERLDFLIEIFTEGGLPEPLARARAHLFYRAFIAESYLASYPGSAVRDAYLKDLARDLLSPDGP